MRNVLVVCSFVLMGGASCSTLSGIKTNADAVKGAADDAKTQKDAAKQTVDDEKAKATAKENGGAGPAGPTRLEATDAPVWQPISDKLDFKKGKINDWRKFKLEGGRPREIATFILHWDEENANLDIDVYDQFGVKIGKSPPRLEGQSEKKILVQIETAGVYYVKVSAPTKADSSIYTMEVRWRSAPKPAVAGATPPPGPAPVPGGPAAPPPASGATVAPAPCPPGQVCPVAPDPNKVFCNIVSVAREGSTVTLYLDKGSSAGFKAGMQGMVLDGADGEKPLDGGNFSLTQVVGSSKAIAKSTTLTKPLGKNKRVVVNLQ